MYNITAKKRRRFAEPITQEAPNIHMLNEWLQALRKNDYAILNVRNDQGQQQ